MKRTLRILGVVIVVLVIILVAVPFLIPVDKFRPTIEQKASQALGRQVQFGSLSLSLLSGSLSADNLSIGDDPKFSTSPFLTAKSLKVGVDILPLIFSKTLNVTGITIESPEVTLLHNSAGVWNFSSLASSSANSEQAKAAKGSGSAAPADISVQKFTLSGGRIIVGSTDSRKRSTYDNVNVVASNFSLTSQFPVTVTADLPAGGKFKLDGTAGPIDQSDASLTPLDAKLNISSLNLASTGFLDAAAGLGGALDLDAAIASHNGEAVTKGTATLSKALLVAGGSPSSVPVTVQFATKYDLRKNAGVLNPSTLKIGNAAAHLRGTYDTAGEATSVNIKLDAKDMPARDLQSFLPALGINVPKGASLQAGTLNADLNLAGPTNKLVTSGNVGLFNAQLAGFDLGSKLTAIASMAGIKTGKDLNIEKLTTDLRMAPEGLKADNFQAVVPSLGNLTGAGTVDSQNKLDFKMVATLTSAASATATPVSSVSGLIGKAVGGGAGCKNGMNVPFQIQGTTADPKFIPDVGGLAAGLLKSQLGCVGGLSTGGAKDAGQAPADAVKALSGLFKKKKPGQ
ncbi:MAG TPA: AsmA family protein [Candidatus Acidoferrum sp.]|nr:AsmA family protein [Candidatus Acidoferrum sp.]